MKSWSAFVFVLCGVSTPVWAEECGGIISIRDWVFVIGDGQSYYQIQFPNEVKGPQDEMGRRDKNRVSVLKTPEAEAFLIQALSHKAMICFKQVGVLRGYFEPVIQITRVQ